MADQSIALDVKTPSFDASPLINATSQYNRDQSLGDLYRARAQVETQQAAGQGIGFRNELVRNAASKAIDTDSWDAAMRDAAQRGAPEAMQYVGRYTPLLQERLFGAYGGTVGGTGAAAPAAAGGQTAGGTVGPQAQQYDRQFQNVPPQQMQTSLSRLNMISDALMTVRDPQSWNAAISKLEAAGIPQAGQFAGQYSPLRVQQLYNAIQPVRSYLQNRITSSSAGLPNPLVQNETKEVGGVLYGVDPYAGTAKPMTPKTFEPIAGAYDAQGHPILYSKQGGDMIAGTPTVPGTVNFGTVAQRIQGIENATGDPAARNPRSTATGNGQFIDSTWLSTIKQARPDLAAKLNDQQLLALRSDPVLSTQMTQAYAKQNAAELGSAGMPVTAATLALAHRFGPDGAQKILSAAPNTPMSEVVSPQVLTANPELKRMTAGQVAQNLVRKVGNDPVDTSSGQVFHQGQFGKPQLVEIDAAKNVKLMQPGEKTPEEGGTVQVLAQQDNRTGQWVTADNNRIPIDAAGAKVIPESMAAGGGSRFAAQVMRVMVNAKDAVSEIQNLRELPITASEGFFGGRKQGPGLMDAVKETLTNKATSQEVQDFNTSMVGLGKALATLESGGLQVNQALLEQFEKLGLREGDTEFTKMRKLATMRQQAENSLEGVLTSPLLGKKQTAFAQGLIKNLQEAVPWTPNDVTALERSSNPKATMADVAKKLGLSKNAAPGSPGTTGQFVPGHVYIDAKGNRATYNSDGTFTAAQ